MPNMPGSGTLVPPELLEEVEVEVDVEVELDVEVDVEVEVEEDELPGLHFFRILQEMPPLLPPQPQPVALAGTLIDMAPTAMAARMVLRMVIRFIPWLMINRFYCNRRANHGNAGGLIVNKFSACR